MTMKQGTIAAQIREKIDLIAALVQSTKPGGGSYSYGEVLRIAGLSDDHRHVRELSNQLIAAGYRRHKAKVRKPAEDVPQPGDVLLDADNGGLQEESAKDIGIYVNIEASALMDALDKVHAACDVLQDLIGKTLNDPVYGRS